MRIKRETLGLAAIIVAGASIFFGNISDQTGAQNELPIVIESSNVNASNVATQAETTEAKAKPAAIVTGTEPGWTALSLDDFYNVNCDEGTWTQKDKAIFCNGSCNGGLSSKKSYKNFELMVQWKHQKRSGNSGLFVWSPKSVLDKMKSGELPQGIEIQILDHGYAEDWEKSKGAPPNWFTTHGDVFPCGIAKMTPFKPAAPNGARSFPRANHSKGVGQWNQYYVRAINGEVRLWVNGHEVSGGNNCNPAEGHIVLEAEGAPILFRNMLIRELP